MKPSAASSVDSRNERAHFARPEGSRQGWLDGDPQLVREQPGEIPNRDGAARADVQHLSIGAIVGSNQEIGARDIAGIDQVARLPAILIDHGDKRFARRVQKMAMTPV